MGSDCVGSSFYFTSKKKDIFSSRKSSVVVFARKIASFSNHQTPPCSFNDSSLNLKLFKVIVN